jgi:hypothetical protein
MLAVAISSTTSTVFFFFFFFLFFPLLFSWKLFGSCFVGLLVVDLDAAGADAVVLSRAVVTACVAGSLSTELMMSRVCKVTEDGDVILNVGGSAVGCEWIGVSFCVHS